MTDSGHIALIDRLRAQPSETEWFEFKRNRYEPQILGEYLSALANSACLSGQPRGYLVFGIDNETHDVVGTRFDPYTVKAKGNQDLLPWLASGLRPNTGLETHIVQHPDGRLVLFEVGPARKTTGHLLWKSFYSCGLQQNRIGQVSGEGQGDLGERNGLVRGGTGNCHLGRS